ncbi:Macrolide export ATP-binding/permease protein MacB [Bacillus rhizoplanae]|uniref:Macrolide export ATP-binding/permease protein MacB n=1 Tax=Bacillus rhizoplanae TaxID=2880966 RepID=A0ABM8YBB9_9BACI|nr:ABC transporter permease [Bacillus rhizoplanae]CAG9612997.1 Macrolide export ATP-binding/permease protein MacB [Bacillus rhizoplanae]
MGLIQSIKMAMRSIKGNKLRAFLTMLGIIIGVSSVIVLVSIGQGSSQAVTNQINSLGTNLLTINMMGSDAIKLTEQDIAKFQKIDGIKEMSPVVSGRVTVKNGTLSTQVSLTGTNSSYQQVRDMKINEGRFLSDMDVEYRQKVIVLGANTAQNLFGFENPVGKDVQVNGSSFKIVGVLASKGGSMGQSGDDVIIMPLSTAQRIVKNTSIQTVYVQVSSEEKLNTVMAQIENKLAGMFPNKQDNYSVFNQKDLVDTMSSVTGTMTMMLGGIACISLLVGGIGIMNIMLVSVSERTKEIGIRKAIGAKRKDILLQFLIEAVVLSSLGGLIGMGIGLLVAKILSVATGMTIAYSVPVILLAFLFSLLVGVGFGVFPANKASKLHPIQALRYE